MICPLCFCELFVRQEEDFLDIRCLEDGCLFRSEFFQDKVEIWTAPCYEEFLAEVREGKTRFSMFDPENGRMVFQEDLDFAMTMEQFGEKVRKIEKIRAFE